MSDLKNKESEQIHILLAEDEQIYQKIIERYIHFFDLEVTIVENGNQCIVEAEGGKYDVILMDIVMPEKDGIEVAREIREKGIKTPIIAVTSNTWAEDKIKSMNAGMNDFLAKPFHAKKLARKIAYWTEQK
ncbi:MAG: response regulator [Bacteroidales bacterium]|nr:response regulator [Bacteroidales bacterium]